MCRPRCPHCCYQMLPALRRSGPFWLCPRWPRCKEHLPANECLLTGAIDADLLATLDAANYFDDVPDDEESELAGSPPLPCDPPSPAGSDPVPDLPLAMADEDGPPQTPTAPLPMEASRPRPAPAAITSTRRATWRRFLLHYVLAPLLVSLLASLITSLAARLLGR